MATFRSKMNVTILTDYPGVVTGTLANNTARAANRTAINAAIADAASAKKLLLVPPATYEIHGGAIIFNNSYQRCYGDPGATFLQYQLDSPCIHVGPPIGTAGQTIEGVTLDGMFLKFAGTGTASTDGASGLVGGHGLELTGAFMCQFMNMQIGDPNQGASGATSVPYTGVYCDPRSGTIPCFSNRFSHIRCKNFVFSGWHQFRNAYDAATGNHYDNIYISAGGAGDVRDISAVGGIPAYFGSLAQSTFNQFNVEWSTAKTAMHLEVCRSLAFQSLNIEGVTLKNGSAADSGVVTMYQSQAAINGCMIQNVTVNSANNVTNPSMFRLQDNSWLTLNGFYPLLNNKTGISNFALIRNHDASGNANLGANLLNMNLGDSDQLDLIDGITFSAGNTGMAFGELADFNNNTAVTLADAAVTHYTYRTPGILRMTPTASRTVTLSRQISSTNATRIPRGVRRVVRRVGATQNIVVANYEATTLATLGTADQSAEFVFDGTNWIYVGKGAAAT